MSHRETGWPDEGKQQPQSRQLQPVELACSTGSERVGEIEAADDVERVGCRACPARGRPCEIGGGQHEVVSRCCAADAADDGIRARHGDGVDERHGVG
jgi:hypothetical protein